MGQKIWSMLADFEGRWVAVDKQGRVVADAATLTDVMSSVGDAVNRVTIVFAAEAGEKEAVSA
jgi:hypothetical protein